jgi:CubicO group peptidase (beta-lactamase class C family)
VEQGRLDLHADVNQYLTSFQVDAAYPQPITLAHLLTHTSGPDEAWDTSTDPAEIPALGEYLARGRLRRVLPPGEAWYYSGVGYALAAYIVETVAHIPFEQYVAANVLQPLGMTHSRYLLAPPLPDGMATGYWMFDSIANDISPGLQLYPAHLEREIASPSVSIHSNRQRTWASKLELSRMPGW